MTIRLFILILCLSYCAITIVKIWECTPRARIWDKSVEGTCVDIPSLHNTSGLFNTITDFMILLIPVKAVWNLKMQKRRKIEIVVIFTVGSMLVSCSSGRTGLLFRTSEFEELN